MPKRRSIISLWDNPRFVRIHVSLSSPLQFQDTKNMHIAPSCTVLYPLLNIVGSWSCIWDLLVYIYSMVGPFLSELRRGGVFLIHTLLKCHGSLNLRLLICKLKLFYQVRPVGASRSFIHQSTYFSDYLLNHNHWMIWHFVLAFVKPWFTVII